MKIPKGNCDGGKGGFPHCGAENIYLGCKSRGQCIKCNEKWKQSQKPPKPRRAISDRKKGQMKEAGQYYIKKIARNMAKNGGKCRCEECGKEIRVPTGRNCCHLLSFGAHPKIYLDLDNSVILGKGEIFGECNCGSQFDDSAKTHEMKIYPKVEQLKIKLKHKYYGS